MARKVFFSFCYSDDINRCMVVRNRWVTYGNQIYSGIIDKAELEKIKRTGEQAVHNWIDKQLEGTSVTVVLLGENTLSRDFVQYEIRESIKRGNAIVGIYINNIRDLSTGQKSKRCNIHSVIREYNDGTYAYFDSYCDEIHDYVEENGYSNLDKWVESAAGKKGK